MEFYRIAYEYLRLSGLNVSINYFQERLESHPQYPSLISLTDLLDEFKVENYALRIENRKNWKQLGFPILAHVVSSEGQADFEIVKKPYVGQKELEFLNKWTGIVLTLGGKKSILHIEHNDQLRKENIRRRISGFIILSLLALLIINQIFHFRITLFLNFLLSLVGLGLTIIIIGKSLGLKSGLGELFCKSEYSDCNKVLNSRLGRFAGDIGLGDASAVFFSSLVIYLTISVQFDSFGLFDVLIFVQVVSFLFTPISIIYQWTLNSWCRLCLAVIVVIWLQAANLIWHLQLHESNFLEIYKIPKKGFILFGLSMLLSSIWIIVKPYMIKEKEFISQKIRIRKWRQDPSWFHVLLPLHKRIDDSVWEREIFYGNPKGALQIIIVSNPYCHYCAKAHTEMDLILEKHGQDIGVRIRFSIKTLEKESEDYSAVFQILSTIEKFVWSNKLKENPQVFSSRDIIDYWYKHQDLSIWENDYKLSNHEPIEKLIRKSAGWCRAMDIHQTPAFFINGHEMPNPHTFKDLFFFIDDYIEILKRTT